MVSARLPVDGAIGFSAQDLGLGVGGFGFMAQQLANAGTAVGGIA